MTRVLVLGAVFVDVVVDVPQLPNSGEDVTGEMVASHVGGCAYNVYGAVRAAGQTAALFAPVGVGQYADVVRDDFKRKRIPVELAVTGADNGWDLAMVEPDGERTFLTIDGIEQHWQANWFERVDIAAYDCFYISGYELENPHSAEIILEALAQRRAGTPVVFDPSPRVEHLPAEVLTAMLATNPIIHCNETELACLMPAEDQLPAKLRRLFEVTHRPVVVTLGARGAIYDDGQDCQVVEGVKVPVTNTIGAGDSHCGGMIAGLLAGKSLPVALQQANRLAALVVQQASGCLVFE